MVFNPLAGGFFSGKYKGTALPTEGRFSDASSYQGKMYRDRYFKPAMFSALEILEPVINGHGLTMVEVALRWIVHHSSLNITNGRDGIVIGFSSAGQLESNLADIEKGPLPLDVVQALDPAWQLTRTDGATFWHGELKYTYDTTKVLFETPT